MSEKPVKVPATFDVYRAIAEVQRALCEVGISKAGKNEAQGFRFRGIDQVYATLSPILVKAGLAMLPNVTAVDRRETEVNGKVKFTTLLTVEYTLLSTRDGSRLIVSCVGEGQDNGDKATSKAVSMAFKYAAISTFAIPVEPGSVDDGDATTVDDQPTAPKAAAALKASAKPAPMPALKATPAALDIPSTLAAIAAADLPTLEGSIRTSLKDVLLANGPGAAEFKAAYQARKAALTPAK